MTARDFNQVSVPSFADLSEKDRIAIKEEEKKLRDAELASKADPIM